MKNKNALMRPPHIPCGCCWWGRRVAGTTSFVPQPVSPEPPGQNPTQSSRRFSFSEYLLPYKALPPQKCIRRRARSTGAPVTPKNLATLFPRTRGTRRTKSLGRDSSSMEEGGLSHGLENARMIFWMQQAQSPRLAEKPALQFINKPAAEYADVCTGNTLKHIRDTRPHRLRLPSWFTINHPCIIPAPWLYPHNGLGSAL